MLEGADMNTLGPWADYLLAQVSTSAALTGLIFVVLSFNFDQIVGDIVWPAPGWSCWPSQRSTASSPCSPPPSEVPRGGGERTTGLRWASWATAIRPVSTPA
jgi:hypothetical protein